MSWCCRAATASIATAPAETARSGQAREPRQLRPALDRHEVEREHVGVRHGEFRRRRRGALHRLDIELFDPSPFAVEFEPAFVVKRVQEFGHRTGAALAMAL